mmetsp:Transcript_27780/g.82922  ORF Transcript_27780/g.82922 Transcript_27780/m.82922 type:complete len:229 (+) Transcript_27780:41-727(+)
MPHPCPRNVGSRGSPPPSECPRSAYPGPQPGPPAGSWPGEGWQHGLPSVVLPGRPPGPWGVPPSAPLAPVSAGAHPSAAAAAGPAAQARGAARHLQSPWRRERDQVAGARSPAQAPLRARPAMAHWLPGATRGRRPPRSRRARTTRRLAQAPRPAPRLGCRAAWRGGRAGPRASPGGSACGGRAGGGRRSTRGHSGSGPWRRSCSAGTPPRHAWRSRPWGATAPRRVT